MATRARRRGETVEEGDTAAIIKKSLLHAFSEAASLVVFSVDTGAPFSILAKSGFKSVLQRGDLIAGYDALPKPISLGLLAGADYAYAYGYDTEYALIISDRVKTYITEIPPTAAAKHPKATQPPYAYVVTLYLEQLDEEFYAEYPPHTLGSIMFFTLNPDADRLLSELTDDYVANHGGTRYAERVEEMHNIYLSARDAVRENKASEVSVFNAAKKLRDYYKKDPLMPVTDVSVSLGLSWTSPIVSIDAFPTSTDDFLGVKPAFKLEIEAGLSGVSVGDIGTLARLVLYIIGEERSKRLAKTADRIARSAAEAFVLHTTLKNAFSAESI